MLVRVRVCGSGRSVKHCLLTTQGVFDLCRHSALFRMLTRSPRAREGVSTSINQSVDWPNCKSHKASHVPRGQGHIRLHQIKVTSGHIKSQQVTSGRPTTGHGFAHEVAVHLTYNENILKQVQYTVIRLCFVDLCYTRFLAYVFVARRARDA